MSTIREMINTSLRVGCPQCPADWTVDQADAGRRAKCTKCQCEFLIDAYSVLLGKLSSPSALERWSAANDLGAVRDRRAIPRLMKSLRTDDEGGGRSAHALAAMRHAEAVPLLIQCLRAHMDDLQAKGVPWDDAGLGKNGSRFARRAQAAVPALLTLCPDGAGLVEPLISLFEEASGKHPHTRAGIVAAFETMLDTRCVQPFVKELYRCRDNEEIANVVPKIEAVFRRLLEDRLADLSTHQLELIGAIPSSFKYVTRAKDYGDDDWYDDHRTVDMTSVKERARAELRRRGHDDMCA